MIFTFTILLPRFGGKIGFEFCPRFILLKFYENLNGGDCLTALKLCCLDDRTIKFWARLWCP